MDIHIKMHILILFHLIYFIWSTPEILKLIF